MTEIYICRLSAYQAKGNQIDIKQEVAYNFFNYPQEYHNNRQNYTIKICYNDNYETLTDIEIQPATNIRFSTKLNKLIRENGEELKTDDYIIFKKIGDNFGVWHVDGKDESYISFMNLIKNDDKHSFIFDDAVPESTPEDFHSSIINALRTKPFLLLAGISGTGKSRIVRELARSCWNPEKKEEIGEYKSHKPRNFEMIQVKPNWHDSSELIGFESRINGEMFEVGPFLRFIVKAMKEPNIPFFLCLDEMNLAPVEQYFAEYLSVLETRKLENGEIVSDPIIDKSIINKKYTSGYDIFEELGLERIPKTTSKMENDKLASMVDEVTSECHDDEDTINKLKKNGLRLPQNLFVIGTVNMDETTYGFSRKVLDRAMTIEMNEVDLKSGLTEEDLAIPYYGPKCFMPWAVEAKDVYAENTDLCTKALDYLEKINGVLDKSPFKVAYRTRNEFLVYVVNAVGKETDETKRKKLLGQALDRLTSMKVLSRIEGDKKKVGSRLEDLKNVVEGMLKDYVGENVNSESRTKIETMIEKLNSGYTDFWD